MLRNGGIMKTSKTFKRNVWRGKRSKLTLSLHPDIVDVIRHVSKEQMLPMSVVLTGSTKG